MTEKAICSALFTLLQEGFKSNGDAELIKTHRISALKTWEQMRYV
jgi:hypothetical protein